MDCRSLTRNLCGRGRGRGADADDDDDESIVSPLRVGDTIMSILPTLICINQFHFKKL